MEITSITPYAGGLNIVMIFSLCVWLYSIMNAEYLDLSII